MDCPAYLSSAIAVGRAAAGIYLILKHHGLAGKEILVPANLCFHYDHNKNIHIFDQDIVFSAK